MDKVISNLTSIITTGAASDQNCDNLIVIADVLTQLANILLTQNVSLEVANLVSMSIKFFIDGSFSMVIR